MTMMLNDMILVCKCNSGCYNSTDYFADQLAMELRRLGQPVRLFDWKKEGAEGLESLFTQSFRAIVDFNSKLPGMEADGRPVLEYLNGPFYDWILDHPLYHHHALKKAVGHDFHVLCLDDDHAVYLQKWYPAVRSVHRIMLAAPVMGAVKQRQWSMKIRTPVFCGTYCDPRIIERCIHEGPEDVQESNRQIAMELIRHPARTIEDATMEFYQANHSDLTAVEFPLMMQMNFLADTYARAYFREKMLDVLFEAGQPVDLYGPNWEEYAQKRQIDKKWVHPEISYEKTLEIQAEHGIVLNIMPWFKNGVHDRIFTAMAGHSVCLSDPSGYTRHTFSEGVDYVPFELDHLEVLPELVKTLQADPVGTERIADSGWAAVQEKHLWGNRARELLQILQADETAR